MTTMTPAHLIVPGMVVECPRRSSVGAHRSSVTHATQVGTGAFRVVVSLDCGHDVNLSAGHGLFAVDHFGEGWGYVNGLRVDHHVPECPGMDEDGNWLGPCSCADAARAAS